MKTVTQEQEAQRLRERKKLALILGGAAALLIVGVVLVVVLAGSGRATVKGTLTEYFGTMYANNGKGFDEMADCFAGSLKDEWYNSMTLYGMNFNQLGQWRMEAIEQVGDNVSVKAKVTETAGGSATDLSIMRQTYAKAEAVCDVIFKLYIDGDDGSMVTHGATELVKLGGKWYFVSTSIPVTVESREGSAQEWYEKYGESTEGAAD